MCVKINSIVVVSIAFIFCVKTGTYGVDKDFLLQNGISPKNSTAAVVASPNYSNTGNNIHATLSFVMKPLGLIECQGAVPAAVENFYGKILGDNLNYTSSDYLCGPTCRGSCVPRPSDVGIPPTMYPFGCKCEQQGCDLNGPLVAPMAKPYFKMVCSRDPACACFGMGHHHQGRFNGFSCQWINTESGLPVTFTEELTQPPRFGLKQSKKVRLSHSIKAYFPIRWCSCCPDIPKLRN